MDVSQPWKRTSVQFALVVGAVSLGVATGVGTTSAVPLHQPRSDSTAVMAKEMALNLTGHLRLVGRPGHNFTEQGQVSGTYSGSATVHFTAISSNTGGATFTFYSSASSVSGHASTRAHVVGAIAYFTGTLSITGGTGKLAHISGSGLRFSGSLERHTFHATTHLSGNVHL